MARIRSVTGRRQTLLDQGWTLTVSAPGGSDDGAEGIPAPVPGTAAQALQAAGLWSAGDPAPLHDRDVVYRTRLTGHGPRLLRFHGLATIAEVRLDGERILTSDSMYLAHEVPVTLNGEAELSIRFHALHPVLAAKKGRARWRPRLAEPAGLRFVRTTLLGHMPGWCPPIHAVGPFRPVELVEETGPCRVLGADLRSGYDGRDGHLSLRLTVEGAAAGATGSVEVAGRTAPLVFDGVDGFSADLTLPGVEPWWPHTHGEPVLHGVVARIGAVEVDLGRVGFRSLEVDRGPDGNGFALLVNGVRVFCRGGCWVPVDLVELSSDRAAYEPELRRMREAGANMVRVGGTMLYEGDAFFELCDELGILVWQDAMFANFDYPTDAAFLDSVRAEIAQLLDRIQASPSLAVLCGGSEMEQQAAMLGLPRASWTQPALTAVIAEETATRRPDLIRVANSPSGGALPFIANAGVTHYYGVGAYMKPLEDARRASVRFASECLAFANLGEDNPLGVPALHHPRWKERVPRDPGASWDFEDVREHYLEALYAVDPRRLRYEDPDRYRRLSRAVTGEVMQAVFDEWRRTGSTCAGGLVWQWRDPWPSGDWGGGWGAGWGVVAADGTPKPAWHALKRAFRPLRVILTDEGVNGLAVHLVNDTARPVEALLRLTAWRDGSVPVLKAERPVTLPARGAATLAAAELSDRFFDTTYAYRFGPIPHDVVTVQLLSAERDAEPIDESHYFPKGRALPRSDLGLTAMVEDQGQVWALRLATGRFACSVHVEDERFQAEDAWFHLPPGVERVVRLRLRAGSGVEDGMASAGRPVPNGEVHALNALAPVRYRGNA
ncbi:glycoside hydrolase family 2 protein (plasmid) [Azospirillum oryzae]|uniref:Glycoside hydrolase family 2 protein n=1 Tax=Azospirillum oryzae TaxID=286727 RepID=A0A6N1APA2_9PROT|nr:glycoside hydrolase family 2 protein [Azospirillum oryzae]KAA0586391.1 glycoside hydrolase family 2 protein [Azospirillum oryzae]QKS53546.1 glycoside hydrolase family 2 protein [Azospirillum oryzae]GLR80332.1 beta-mannosidase [Azospirillum oryzae]